MKNKISEKKNKKKVQWRLEWATAHFLFVLSHDTIDCIVTQGAQHARMDRQDTTTIWLGTTTTRRSWVATQLARARGTNQRARHGVLYHDTGFVSRQGGQCVRVLVQPQLCHDTVFVS